jgi:hypothetical protein
VRRSALFGTETSIAALNFLSVFSTLSFGPGIQEGNPLESIIVSALYEY